MLNFLPEKYKKNLQREYLMRLFSVFFICAGVIAFGLAGLLIPYDFFVTSQEGTAANRLASLIKPSGDESAQSFQRTIDEIRTKAKQAFPTDPNYASSSVASILMRVAELRKAPVNSNVSAVTISSFSYTKEADGSVSLNISGKSPNRESLRAFGDRLKVEPGFSGIDIPISNFVQDKNISFSIAMKIKF